MSSPQPHMSPEEITALMRQVAQGAVTVKTAISLMALNGVDQQEAARSVFVALGGSDKTELDAEGRVRYAGSGKLVSEVERAISG